MDSRSTASSLVVAGGVAGMISKTVCSPLERLRILLQAGVVQNVTLRKIWDVEGITGFWRGNWTGCLRVFPHKGLLFASQDLYKQQLAVLLGDDKSTGFISGAAAGLTSVLLLFPLDLARGRISGTMGDGRAKYRGTLQTLAVTFREEGLRGWYRGICPTLFGTIPFSGVKFGVYDYLLSQHDDCGMKDKVVFGGVAGLVANSVMYPNDTIRRRLMMPTCEYSTAREAWRGILAKEGPKGLYRGIGTTLARAAPSTAIQFVAFGWIKSWMVPADTEQPAG